MDRPIIVFACDLTEGGCELGPETKARCDVATQRVQEYKNRREKGFLIVSAGMSDKRKYPQQEKLMSVMMRDYLVSIGVPSEQVILGKPVWGSRGELQEALRIILGRQMYIFHPAIIWKDGRGIVRDGEDFCLGSWSEYHIDMVSGWYHKWRLIYLSRKVRKMIPLSRRKDKWHIQFLATKGSFKSFLWELIKLPTALVRR